MSQGYTTNAIGTEDNVANTLAKRDANGQFKVGAPTDDAHPARKQDVGSIGSGLKANASGGLTLTTSFQDVPGASVTLDKAGRWLIFAYGTGVGGANVGIINMRLLVDGAAQINEAKCQPSNGRRDSMGHSWLYTAASSGLVAKIQAKSSSTTESFDADGSAIVAVYLGA